MSRVRGALRNTSHAAATTAPERPDGAATGSAATGQAGRSAATGPVRPGGLDDLMPTRPVASRRSRRRSQTRLRWLAGGVAAVVVVVLLAWAVTARDDDTSSANKGARISTRTRRTGGVTSTTSVAADRTDSSTSVSTSGSSVASPSTVPATSPTAGGGDTPAGVVLEIAQDPGACTYDAANELVLDAGTMRNPGTDPVVVEIEVTWSDVTGEIGSDTYLDSVAGGATATWDVSADAVDGPPPGLSCSVAQI